MKAALSAMVCFVDEDTTTPKELSVNPRVGLYRHEGAADALYDDVCKNCSKPGNRLEFRIATAESHSHAIYECY